METTGKENILARIIREKGITVEQFARLLGYSHQRTGKLLKSRRPSVFVANAVARELHMKLEELMDEDGTWKWVDVAGKEPAHA